MCEKFDALHDISLESVSLFRCVSPESLQGIIDCCEVRSLEERETLLLPDCENRELFILLSGRLRVHLRDADSEPISVIEPGEA